ncbi:MAG: hypothetical protein PHG02_08165 [Oscillospiraceae bacterium]|nr:hypothetical protein [Oscillospiraceae bacterium]
MKKTGFVISFFLCLITGGLRYLDYAHLTNIQTGFFVQGTLTSRLGIVTVVLLFVLVTSIGITAPRGMLVQRGGVVSLGLVIASAAALFCGAGGVLYNLTQMYAVWDFVLSLLFVINGLWLLIIAFAFFGNPDYIKKMSAMLAVVAVSCYYLLTVIRFITKPSSLYRLTKLIGILSPLAALLFLTAFVKALYLSGNSGKSRGLYFFGLAAFLFCFCLSGADLAAGWGLNMIALPELFKTVALMAVGLLGMLCAFVSAESSQVHAPHAI